MEVPVREVAAALGLRTAADGVLLGVTTDSRAVRPGDCFIALSGRNFDGRQFVEQALSKGAVLAIGGPGTITGARTWEVKDPIAALGTIASLVRDRFTGPVIGITGSAGKTTVKEFLRTLISPTLRTVAPLKSFNNREGVPRTITSVGTDTQVLIVEIGTNAPGEIAELCALAKPTIGVLTSIGPSHLQGLGSIEGVLQEKLALARSLPRGSTLIVNADDPILQSASFPEHVKVLWVGLRPDGRREVRTPALPRSDSTLCFSDGGPPIHHNLDTEVLVRNLWISLNVARILGVSKSDLAISASGVMPAPLRGERRRVGASELIVDCYNANPLSMTAALKDLAGRSGRRSAVLGEMLELGPETESRHRELGRLLSALRLDEVLVIGPSAVFVKESAVLAGADAESISSFATTADAADAFARLVGRSGCILLKGSRGMALERLIEASHD